MPNASVAQTLENRRDELNQVRDHFHEQLNQLPFNALRLEFASLGAQAFAAEETELLSLSSSASQIVSEWPQKLGAVQFYPDVEEMTSTYLAAFMAEYGRPHLEDRVLFVPPFEYPFEHEVDFQSVSFGGDIVEVKPYWSEGRTGLRWWPSHLGYIAYYPDDKSLPLPTAALGTIKLQVPGALDWYVFDRIEPNAVRSSSSHRISVVDYADRYLEVFIEQADGQSVSPGELRAYVEAENANGHAVRTTQSQVSRVTDPQGQWEAATELLDLYLKNEINEDKALEAARALNSQASDGVTLRAAFGAPISSATVYVAETEGGRTVEHAISVPVVDYTHQRYANGLDDMSIPMRMPVVDLQMAKRLTRSPASLSADDVAKSYHIVASSSHVRFHVGQALSDLLFDFTESRFSLIEPLIFYNQAGQVMDVTVPERQSAIENRPYSFFDGQLLLYHQNFDEVPQRVAGRVEVTFFPDLLRDYYSVDDLPQGLQVKGNMILVGGFYRRNLVRVVALDGNDRPLRNFFSRSIGGRGILGASLHYYHGAPERVLVIQPGPISKLNRDFDIALPRPSQ